MLCWPLPLCCHPSDRCVAHSVLGLCPRQVQRHQLQRQIIRQQHDLDELQASLAQWNQTAEYAPDGTPLGQVLQPPQIARLRPTQMLCTRRPMGRPVL
jgi:hypothetical protein|eukprot:COSAG01_NODE_4050_length_5401_cov_4.215956_4_plen_98_part_00